MAGEPLGGEPPAVVARAGIEPATRGFSVGDSGSNVLRGSPRCDETAMMLEVVDAQGSTDAPLALTATRLRHHVAAEPRHVAGLLRGELEALDLGDIEGARDLIRRLLLCLDA
jgi:hypothetical protein